MHADPVIHALVHFDRLDEQTDAIERQEAAESEAVNKITTAIRKASRDGHLSTVAVRQVLETLACEMVICGFCDGDVEMTETLAESIG